MSRRPAGRLTTRPPRTWRANGIAVGITDYAPNRVMPPHAHETLGISIVLRGSVQETSGRAVEHGRATSAVIKPPGTVHANRFGPSGARLLAVELSAERAAGLLDHRGCLDEWRWIRVLNTLGVAGRTYLELAGTSEVSDGVLENVAVDLVAALDHDLRDRCGSATPP